MKRKKILNQLVNTYRKYIHTLVVLLSLLGLIFINIFFYQNIWQHKELHYQVLPTLQMDSNNINGVIISNRGRVPLTGIQIIYSDMDTIIEDYSMPGVHEVVTLVEGGIGENNLALEMLRLSPGSSLSLFLITKSQNGLIDAKENILIASNEVIGTSEISPQPKIILIQSFIYGVINTLILLLISRMCVQISESKER